MTTKTQKSFWSKKKTKTFLICGLGKTGKALFQLFKTQKISFYIFDDFSVNSNYQSFLNVNRYPVENLFVDQDKKTIDFLLANIDEVIISPGFPRKKTLIQKMIKNNIPVLHEIDFFFPLIKNKKIIAITGSNGKTTVTKLGEKILQKKYKVFCGGNIGEPLASVILKINSYDVFLLEISSYMLEQLQYFRPNIAIITNLSKDHLDRYDSFQHYISTKINLLKYMGRDDVFLKNDDDKYISKIKNITPKIIHLGLTQKQSPHYIKDNILYYNQKRIVNLLQLQFITPSINLLFPYT